jgi:iron complex outermembrane recepter protein
VALGTGRPNTQGAYGKYDLGLSLQSADHRWELAVIGKNIGDKITTGLCEYSNVANGYLFGGEVTGGTGRGPAGVDEEVCWPDPGREIWVRLTYKPFSK